MSDYGTPFEMLPAVDDDHPIINMNNGLIPMDAPIWAADPE